MQAANDCGLPLHDLRRTASNCCVERFTRGDGDGRLQEGWVNAVLHGDKRDPTPCGRLAMTRSDLSIAAATAARLKNAWQPEGRAELHPRRQ